MKKMLINATRSEELRVAIVDANTQNLLDVIVGRQSYKTTVGNIYLAKVSSIEKSLGAAFVNFGSERHGFLPLKEISKEYFEKVDASSHERANIKELIKEGQYLMVQVEKEERGNKGAALTTFISLAGSYLVLMPNNPRAGGISRRVEGDDRDDLRDILAALPLPEGMGIIVRTAGVGKCTEELEWDLNNLLKQWEAIKHASLEHDPPFFIHEESDLVTRIIRDYLREDFTEIVIDDPELFEKVKAHIKQVRPGFTDKVKLYSNNTPLFNHFQIEQKIESTHQRAVVLPSGGSVVIDHTEALVAIDINSARANKGKNIEDTAFTTNMEAAEEIARQLRLRDIGGLIVIDFIDMASARNRREVENNLRNALKLDKARTQIGTISPRFGLLEMSRQRLRHSLGEATQVTCPRCSGWGTIRGVESLALSIIRMIEEDAVKQTVGQVQMQLPVDVATFIINEKRDTISDIEKRHNVEVLIIPNPHLESPHYHVKRLAPNEVSKNRNQPSYFLIEKSDTNTPYKKAEETRVEEGQGPAVVHTLPTHPAPTKKNETGLIKRLIGSLFGSSEEEEALPPPKAQPARAPSAPPASRTSQSTTRPNTQRTRQSGAHTKPTTTSPHKRDSQKPSSEHHHHKRTISSSTPIKKTEEPRVTTPEKTDLHIEPAQAPASVPTPTPMPMPVTAPPTSPPTHPEKKETDKEEVTKPRTRRGTRGGRRRGNPNFSQRQTNEPSTGTSTAEAPSDLLPPFPADLETYYKQDITKTAPKQPREVKELKEVKETKKDKKDETKNEPPKNESPMVVKIEQAPKTPNSGDEKE